MAIITNGNISKHWNYFLALEDDLAEVSRYIEFSEDNFETYSIELAHLLLAAASEVDVVLKSLCNIKAPDETHESINQYRETIRKCSAYLISEYCTIPRFGLRLTPWSEWKGKEDKNPLWWTAYNKVKHHRDSHFKEANLKNVLNAMSALALVNIYLQKQHTRFPRNSLGHMSTVVRALEPQSSLINFNPDYYYSLSIIITTLAAQAYNQEPSIAATLYGILSRMEDHIEDRPDGPWIPNPTDPLENFADKWSMPKFPNREAAFYDWLERAKKDFALISGVTDRVVIAEALAPSMGSQVVDKALNKRRKGTLEKLLSIRNPKHKKEPPWDFNIDGHVEIIEAECMSRGFSMWRPFQNDGKPLRKDSSLRFKAHTNVTGDYQVYWQVVNTGFEAARANGLRGGFEITKSKSGSLVRDERTMYTGSHTIECFIIKNGFLVARSGEFIVNIM